MLKEIFDEFNPDLVGSFLSKDSYFVAQLTSQHLFSGSLKEVVMRTASRADAALKFLFGAIERPLNIGNWDPFDRLPEVMERLNDATLNKLAKDIKQKLGVNEIVHANSGGQAIATHSSQTDTPGNEICIYSVMCTVEWNLLSKALGTRGGS